MPSRAKDVEESGRWYFKRDILDRLDEYFLCLRHLKSADREAYDWISSVGAVVAHKGFVWDTGPRGELHGAAQDDTVGIGAVMLSVPEDNKNLYPKFIYFRKVARPSASVEMTNDVVYEVGAFYTAVKEFKIKAGYPMIFYVAIGADGTPRALRQRLPVWQKIIPKTPAGRRMGGAVIQRHQWMVPPFVEHMAKEHGITVNACVKCFISYAYDMYRNASMDTRVRVENRGCVATFCVDMLRTPHFFDDREIVLGPSGHKRKIFHIVRTHARRVMGISTTSVRSHFRGLRRFEWNGYQINITVPGKHHADVLDFTGGSFDHDPKVAVPINMTDLKDAGERIGRHINV